MSSDEKVKTNMSLSLKRISEIEERLISGHWESNRIKGGHGRCAVENLNERSAAMQYVLI